MGLLRTGAAWLAQQLGAHESEAVLYRRGDLSATPNAVLGSSEMEVSNEEGGVRIERTDRDFLIAPAELVLGGATVEPAKGDQIVHDGGTYEVLGTADAPAWRWSNQHETLMRIHTKLVREE